MVATCNPSTISVHINLSSLSVQPSLFHTVENNSTDVGILIIVHLGITESCISFVVLCLKQSHYPTEKRLVSV